MDIRQLQYFVALYEEGSVTRAARRMHVVQPAISQQIKRLEADFGVQLFERAAHGTAPTTAARDFYAVCLSILNQLRQAEAVLREASRQPAGRLTLGAQASMNQHIVPTALSQFHARYPAIAISARDGYRADLVDWLNRGEIDFALLSATQEKLHLASLTLCQESLVAVGHPDTLAGRDAMPGEALAGFKLVLHSRSKSLRTLIDNQFGLHGLDVRPDLEIDALPSVLALVRQPGWLSIVPRTAVAPDAAQDGLAWLPLRKPSLHRDVMAAWSPQRPPAVYMAPFLELLRLGLAGVQGVTLAGRPAQPLDGARAGG